MASPQMTPAPASSPSVTPAIPCKGCGLHVPTKLVTIYQNVGMLVARQTTQNTGNFCRRCIRKYVASYSLTTFVLGWWGMISAIITPFLLIANLVVYLKSLSMPEPDLLAAGIAPGMPVPGPQLGSQKWKVALAGVIVLAILGFIGYKNPDFMEAHFPRLNAMLHSGEISAGEDADYAWNRVSQDMQGLDAPMKTQGFAAQRNEYLQRESFLTDLQTQNSKLQAAGQRERGQTNNDACEKLVLDELLPAVAQYTTAEQQVFATLKSAPEDTAPVRASLEASYALEDSAHERIKSYGAHGRAQGCFK